MKKIILSAFLISLGFGLVSCGGASGDDPGNAYMPDMYYSRAYEAYNYNNVGGEHDSLLMRRIYYSGLTVPGTVARGESLPNHLTNDSTGLTAADGLTNPLANAAAQGRMLTEGERLYLVNCGICHGTALDGNGPLFNDGNGAFPVKPTQLNDAKAKAWTDGHYFHVITFGKGAMGSYASQLRPEQRWMVINYIRNKQGGGSDSTATATNATATMAADTTMN